jgi:SOUL heme-binding protein
MQPSPSSFVRTLALSVAILAAAPAVHAIEEPAFEVVRQLNDRVELRRYAPYVVAEVLVPGPAEDAGNQAFPILAGYIFGKNQGERKLEMTAPVTQAAAPVKLPMTAPVTQAPAAGGFIVQFVLPRSVTLATAPQPLDTRVKLREVPPSRVAAIRFSGFWSDANYNEHLALLQAALKDAAQPWTGDPVYARYNAPITPWFMRRNEIWLALPD